MFFDRLFFSGGRYKRFAAKFGLYYLASMLMLIATAFIDVESVASRLGVLAILAIAGLLLCRFLPKKFFFVGILTALAAVNMALMPENKPTVLGGILSLFIALSILRDEKP